MLCRGGDGGQTPAWLQRPLSSPCCSGPFRPSSISSSADHHTDVVACALHAATLWQLATPAVMVLLQPESMSAEHGTGLPCFHAKAGRLSDAHAPCLSQPQPVRSACAAFVLAVHIQAGSRAKSAQSCMFCRGIPLYPDGSQLSVHDLTTLPRGHQHLMRATSYKHAYVTESETASDVKAGCTSWASVILYLGPWPACQGGWSL